MPASHTANLGLNKPDRQDLVSVVTDINDNMETIDNAIGALPASHTIQGQINTLKPVSVVLNPVTNANGETTVVTNDSRIHEGLKAVYLEVSNPETFKDKIKITTGNGTVTLYCANAVGSSDVTILVEMATVTDSADPQPASVTSTEFDILANRIGTLSQLTTTEKTNLVGAVNELNSQLTHLVTQETKSTDSVTIAGNGTYTFTIDFAKSGYAPIAIAHLQTNQGTYSPVTGYWWTGNTLNCFVRNFSSSNLNTYVVVTVTYIKASFV